MYIFICYYKMKIKNDMCNRDLYYIINKYIDVGWFKLTEVFNQKKYGKEKDITHINENLLKLLGAIRIYLVNNTFDCLKDKEQYIIASGSTEITSDFDNIIIGRNASKIMYKMFLNFLKKYHNILPFSFDTNLYCSGLYLLKYRNKYLDSEEFVINNINLFTYHENEDSIKYALLKLIDNEHIKYNKDINLLNYKGINKYLSESISINNELNLIYEKYYNIIYDRYNKEYKKETLEIITKYYLQYVYGNLLEQIIYKNIKKQDLLQKYSSFLKFFSIESYYTQSAVNVIVVVLQNNIKLKHINKYEYISTIIENLGDFIGHYSKECNDNSSNKKRCFLKYSKYIYRIYYCLSKLSFIYKRYSYKLLKYVIPYRKTTDNNKIDEILNRYFKNFDIYNFKTKILEIINNLL